MQARLHNVTGLQTVLLNQGLRHKSALRNHAVIIALVYQETAGLILKQIKYAHRFDALLFLKSMRHQGIDQLFAIRRIGNVHRCLLRRFPQFREWHVIDFSEIKYFTFRGFQTVHK